MGKRKITDGLELRPDGIWRRSETIGGRRRFFASKDPAEIWAKIDRAKMDYAEQERAEAAQRDMGPLFAELADEYEQTLASRKTGLQRSYLPAIRRARDAFGEYRMREIEPYMIAEFLKTRMATYAATTVSNQKTVINNIFQLWIDSPAWRGDYNPAKQTFLPRGMKKGKRPPPTDEQVKIVREYYLDPDALTPVAYLCTGERKGELCAITLGDIDFKKKIIRITKQVEHRNNRPCIHEYTKTEAGIRSIPLLAMLEEALQPIRHMPKGTYIVGLKREPVTASAYRRLWERFWRKYGQAVKITREKQRAGKTVKYSDWKIPVCGHQFRHEYVCMLAMAEVPEEIAIQIVGHANAKMIHEVYLSIKPQMLEDTRAKLNSFLSNVQ